MIIDLTGIHNGAGPAGLLDTVEGRSKHAFTTWLAPNVYHCTLDCEEPACGGTSRCSFQDFYGASTTAR